MEIRGTATTVSGHYLEERKGQKENSREEIPDFIKNAKSGDILATSNGDLLMVERVEISTGAKSDEVAIYYYFNYENGQFFMNEWLNSFYGPRYIASENFYRPATEKEKEFFLAKMKEYGYKLEDFYGKQTPAMTDREHQRRYHDGKCRSRAARFIKDCTRGCSNELFFGKDLEGNDLYGFEYWITPEQALAACEIEKEEILKKIAACLKTRGIGLEFLQEAVEDTEGV